MNNATIPSVSDYTEISKAMDVAKWRALALEQILGLIEEGSRPWLIARAALDGKAPKDWGR